MYRREFLSSAASALVLGALPATTFSQVRQIFIMNSDGTGKRLLTDSLWEDSMPLYVPG
jgi:hypothetical protein